MNITGETIRDKKLQEGVIFQANSEEGQEKITSHKQLPRLQSNTVNPRDMIKMENDNEK